MRLLKMDNIYNEIIQEMYGLGFSKDMKHFRKLDQPFMNSGINRGNPQDSGPKVGEQCGHRLNSWQQLVYKQILKKGSAIVSVPPAAGKTMPMTCAWKYKFIRAMGDIRAGRRITIPRIAVVVPTQQLAFQIGKQDFLRDKASGLLRMIAENPEIFQHFLINTRLTHSPRDRNYKGYTQDIDPRTGQQKRTIGIGPPPPSNNFKPDLRKLNQREINEIYRIIDNEFLAIIYGGVSAKEQYTPKTARKIFGDFKPIVIGTYEPMKNLLSRHAREFDIIVIDETQEFLGQPRKGSVPDGLAKKQEAFIDIISSAAKNKNNSLLLLTGSTNNRTVEDIKDVINDTFGTRLEKIPKKLPDIDIDKNDPNYGQAKDEVKNRSSIKIMPFDRMASPYELKKTCIDIIRNKQKNSIMLLFSIKRQTNGGIFRIIEDIIPELPIVNKEVSNYGEVKSKDIRVDLKNLYDKLEALPFNDPGRSKIEREIKQLKSLRTGAMSSVGGATSVEDYDKHHQQKHQGLDATELADRDAGDYIGDDIPMDIEQDSPQVSEIEFLKYFDIRAMENKAYRNKALDEPDPNNLLYQAALRGIGVMGGSMHQRHKETIQKLFKNGKLYLLFASNALGV